ncbi:MAG: SRPBCC family protein [Saprospiraceae bacterium]|nr:SRPBCC family protein [Saprospiraceae bacterium]
MKVKRKSWKQFIPRPVEEVWDFFSRPENLNAITPPDMSFEILSEIDGIEMYQGMMIQYKISPFLGIKMDWVTEITHAVEGQYFIDEQRFGPYALWHHQHHFKPVEGGVEMEDILHYKVPYGLIGTLTDRIFVGQKIESIFQYRSKAIENWFFDKSRV